MEQKKVKFNEKNKIKNMKYEIINLSIIFFCGLLINLPFFILELWTELLVFFIISPVFISLTKLSKEKLYLAGVLFFGAWMIPTSIWYFNFMPWWLACLALTFFSLKANIFRIFNSLQNKGIFSNFILLIFSWTLFNAIFLHFPIIRKWWLPHLAYTQWQNILAIQIISIMGVAGLIFIILFSNVIMTYLWMKTKKAYVFFFVITLVFIFIIGNNHIISLSEKEIIANDINLISVQVNILNEKEEIFTKEDLDILIQVTKKAISEIDDTNNKKTFVIWPENEIPSIYSRNISDFVKKENIYLTYNTPIDNKNSPPFDSVITLNSEGNEILRNYKLNKAPGENITEYKGTYQVAHTNSISFSSIICYDLHFPISKNFSNASIIFASADFGEFGSFSQNLYAKDIIFRSIENRIAILVSSTTGPTLFVDKYGVIKEGPITFNKIDSIIINKIKN